jgi:guanine nucleotide-binding protein subunit alpha
VNLPECRIDLTNNVLVLFFFQWAFFFCFPGSGESGKSTIVKQMKVIHQGGYSTEELATYRLTVYKNLVDSAQSLVLAMEKLRLEPTLPENKANAYRILDYRVEADPYFTLSADIVNAIDSLYHDPITATCMERSSEFYIMDSAP